MIPISTNQNNGALSGIINSGTTMIPIGNLPIAGGNPTIPTFPSGGIGQIPAPPEPLLPVGGDNGGAGSGSGDGSGDSGNQRYNPIPNNTSGNPPPPPPGG